MATVGTGATIAFGTNTGWISEIYDISLNASRAVIPTTNLSTTGGTTYMPGSLYNGVVSVIAAYGEQDLPMADEEETITIDVGTATWQFSGFIADATVRLPLEDRREVDITIQITGANTAIS